MGFLNPIWLWGLCGLTIPLAIHLLSRKEGKVIRIGSLRYLSESATQHFKSFRLNEVMLLAIRLLLIALFVFLMSDLRINSGSKEKWILVEPGLEENKAITPLLDSLKKRGFQVRHFTKNFPEIGQALQEIEFINYWGLVEELEKQAVKEVVIISSSRMTNFKNEQVTLPGFVKWIVVDPERQEFLLATRRVSGDSAQVRRGITSATRTEFVSSLVFAPNLAKSFSPDSLLIHSADTVRINLVAEAGFEYDQKIMLAALQVIQQKVRIPIEVREGADEFSANGWLFWFSENEPPGNGNKLLLFKKSNEQELITQVGPAHWVLSGHLHEDIVLKKNLIIELGRMLLPAMNQNKIAHEDLRVMPEAMRWAGASSTPSKSKEATSIDTWLVLAFFLTLIIERLLSYRKNL